MAKSAKKATARKAKSAKTPKTTAKVIVLAEKLGSFLGRARKQADALLGTGRATKAKKARKARKAKKAK